MIIRTLNLHACGDLDLALLPLVAGDTVSETGGLGATTIGPGCFLANDDILEAEFKARRLGLDLHLLLFLALLGEALALLLCGFLLTETFIICLEDLAVFGWFRLTEALVSDQVRVRNTGVRGLEDLLFSLAFSNLLNIGGFLRYAANGFCRVGSVVGDLLVLESWCGREDTTSIDTVKLAGFGDRIEDLRVSQFVDGKIVN